MAELDALHHQLEQIALNIGRRYNTLHNQYDKCQGIFDEDGWYAFTDELASNLLLAFTGAGAARFGAHLAKMAAKRSAKRAAKRSGRMFQQGAVRGETLADRALLDAMRKKGRSINLATPGSEDLRLLQAYERMYGQPINASVSGVQNQSIILRPDARKIEALEEFLHGTQSRKGIIEKLRREGAEVHVKDFMIRHRRLLGLSDGDVAALLKLMGR